MFSIKRAVSAAFLTLAVLGAVGQPTPVFACSCVQMTEAEQFENATLVFSGVVKSISQVGMNNSVKFQVNKLSKGDSDENVTVTTGLDEAACGFNFEIGNTYQVYTDGDDKLSTGICNGTRLLTEAEEPQAATPVPSQSIDDAKQSNDTGMQIVTALIGVVVGSGATYLVLKRHTNS